MPGYSVIGVARSGVAAANALARRGESVQIADPRDAAALARFLSRLDPRVAVRLGGNHFRHGDIVVVSPGIPPRVPLFREAREAGCEVIGEIALFQRLAPPGIRVACVTGTDGKSTTTAWLGAMCAASGRPTWVGGNIGIPLCESLDILTAEHLVVAEVSCFQLWTSTEWHPRVAVLTNIAPDHLDYYEGDFDRYVACKRAVLANLGPGDSAVVNADDPILSAWEALGGARTLHTSRRSAPAAGREGVWSTGREIRCRVGAEEETLVGLDELRVPGAHNVENATAAAAGALALGVAAGAVRQALVDFRGLEHRIEHVRTLGGVDWYNDSKATNPHAGEAALRAFPGRPLVLLAGGSEKGSDFSDWADLVAATSRHAICFGQTADRILGALAGRIPTTRVRNLSEAVLDAQRITAGGDVVVLSPACASFDQFEDFEHRGRCFKELVGELRHG